MNPTDRRIQFRALLQADAMVHPASVFDPISARLAQAAGFELGMFAGSTASLTVLGAPDLALLTLSEFADQAHRIGRACDLPLLVDADHGYGNALNVMRTVQELETAGVAGLTIEDTLLPAPFGNPTGDALISVAEGVGKMKAALAGRSDALLAVFGRTSALALASTEEAVRRAQAYEAAGVDGLFFTGIATRAQLDAVAAATSLPLILSNPAEAVLDRDYLRARRVKICLQGHAPIAAAIQALANTYQALRAGVPTAELKDVAGKALMREATCGAAYDAWIKSYLT